MNESIQNLANTAMNSVKDGSATAGAEVNAAVNETVSQAASDALAPLKSVVEANDQIIKEIQSASEAELVSIKSSASSLSGKLDISLDPAQIDLKKMFDNAVQKLKSPVDALAKQMQDIKDGVVSMADINLQESQEKIKQEMSVYTAKITEQVQTIAENMIKLIEKKLRELARIPDIIVEKIKEIKTIFSLLLGKFQVLLPGCDITKIDFDVSIFLQPIMVIIETVIGCLNPLLAVLGNVPVIGDLMGLINMLISSKSDPPSNVTPQQLQLAFPNKMPSLPDHITEEIDGLVQEIKDFVNSLPMMFFNIVFGMIGAIWSCFETIQGVIGVPPMIFPLNLIPAAIKAVPECVKLMQQAPTVIKNALLGHLKKKWAEMQLMGVSTKPPSLSEIRIMDVSADPPQEMA